MSDVQEAGVVQGTTLFVVRVKPGKTIMLEGTTKSPNQVVVETDNPAIALTWAQKSESLETLSKGKALDVNQVRQIVLQLKEDALRATKMGVEASLELLAARTTAEMSKAVTDGAKAVEALAGTTKSASELVEEVSDKVVQLSVSATADIKAMESLVSEAGAVSKVVEVVTKSLRKEKTPKTPKVVEPEAKAPESDGK